MPKTAAEKKMHAAMIKQYGSKKGEKVYHATINKQRKKKK